MTHRLAALAALAILMLSGPAALACPEPSSEMLFHSCWGEARVTIALLPEDLPLPPAPETGRRLVVTGAYTATDKRTGEFAKPVGLFVHGGKVVNPNLGRMDGVLVVDAATGWPTLQHRERLILNGRFYKLTDLTVRRAFLREAAADGSAVLQSHLLIADGKVDVADAEGAPTATRRLLFTDDEGFGVFQTARPETLRGAAERLAQIVSANMALNLDMGSYDYCMVAVDGAETNCGGLLPADTAKLSNLIVLTLK